MAERYLIDAEQSRLSVGSMDLLQFFDREDEKYAELYENVLSDSSYLNDDVNKEQIEKTLITAINTRLDRAATQLQGFSLLSRFSNKISKENLSKHFSHWIAVVTRTLENAPSGSPKLMAACKTIAALIASCKQVSELDKRISIYCVKQLLGIIQQRFENEKIEVLLNLFIVLLYYYPESCARFQASFTPIISSCIDELKNHLVITGSKCYSLLVRALERSFAHSAKNNPVLLPDNNSARCHVSHQINLCQNLCAILDELFQDLVTADSEVPYELQDQTNVHKLQLPDILSHDILEYYTDTEKRFSNICTYLSMLLKVGASGGKKFVLPNVILQVICRGLAITPANLHKNNDDNAKDMLLLVLPKLHTALLNVLEALISNFRQELLPFALTIQRLILQTLDWTREFQRESFRSVRLLAYKILSIWLREAGSLSGFQLVADEFLPHITKDISPPNKNVLVLNTKQKKHLSKNSSKADKSKEAQLATNGIDGTDPVSSQRDLITSIEVLLCVQSIISKTSCYLKPSFYDTIKNAVVLLLYDQYVKKNSISFNKVNTEQRLQLLRTLRVLITHEHVSTPSPTSYAVQIFNTAISQDGHPEIIEEARFGLAELRFVINPTAPTLMLPKSKPSDESSSQPSSPRPLRWEDICLPESVHQEPSEPAQPVKPSKPKESTTLKTETTKPKTPSKTIEPSSSNKSIKPGESSSEEPKESTSPTEAAAPTEPAKPVEFNELIKPTKAPQSNGVPANDESDAPTEPAKRLRLDENSHVATAELLKASMTKPKNDIIVIDDDDEMVLAFCDEPSAN